MYLSADGTLYKPLSPTPCTVDALGAPPAAGLRPSTFAYCALPGHLGRTSGTLKCFHEYFGVVTSVVQLVRVNYDSCLPGSHVLMALLLLQAVLSVLLSM
jgi:hypothetical protein